MGLELTFKAKQSEDVPFSEVCGGQLPGYSVWSEAPRALLLRCLHLLRVQWFPSIPAPILEHTVRELSVSVLHMTRNGHTGPELVALKLKKVGIEDGYTLTQTLPNRAQFPMDIDADSAVPLGAALKALAQVQLEAVDLQSYPVAVRVPELTDDSGQRHVLRDQLPYYAVAAFDAYSALQASSHRNIEASLRSESLVAADAWANFLAA